MVKTNSQKMEEFREVTAEYVKVAEAAMKTAEALIGKYNQYAQAKDIKTKFGKAAELQSLFTKTILNVKKIEQHIKSDNTKYYLGKLTNKPGEIIKDYDTIDEYFESIEKELNSVLKNLENERTTPNKTSLKNDFEFLSKKIPEMMMTFKSISIKANRMTDI
jgi:hypothetical protein